MYDLLRMKHVFSKYMTNTGIFKALASAGVPWSEDVNYVPLDILYIENHSGEKIISPMVKKRLNGDNEISAANVAVLAGVLTAMYGEKWARLWDVFNAEYDPISNYDMTEHGTDITNHTGTDGTIKTGSLNRSGAITRTGSLDRSGAITKTGSESVSDDVTYSGKETNKRSGNIVDTGSGADNTENRSASIYGYNSSNAVPSGSENVTASHKNTQTFNNVEDEKSFSQRSDNRDIVTTFTDRADTDTRKDTYNNIADTDTRRETYNNIKDERTLNTKDRTEHDLTRKGNIGVTTSQQMIESEYELRKWLFFEEVMLDIDKLLTLSIY